MKSVFLTGVSGFIGSHLADRFLADGWNVKGLVRNPARRGRTPKQVHIVPGQLLDANSYRAELLDCEAIVHVAGAVKALRLSDFRNHNARGAETLATAANIACPKAMFVLVSSQAAAGPARNGNPVSESDPPRPVSWYGMSKLEGEQAVERCFHGPWCVVRPGVVYGEGDPGLLELFQIAQKGFVPLIAGGRSRVNLIAVEDLAEILFRAASRPDLSGRRGFAAVDTVSMRDLAMEIAAFRKPPARMIPVPAMAIRLAGRFESIRQAITRKPLAFNRDKVRDMLQRDWLCESTPLLADLGFRLPDAKEISVTGTGFSAIVPAFTPWKIGIRQVCRCYLKAQWLRSNVWDV